MLLSEVMAQPDTYLSILNHAGCVTFFEGRKGGGGGNCAKHRPCRCHCTESSLKEARGSKPISPAGTPNSLSFRVAAPTMAR